MVMRTGQGRHEALPGACTASQGIQRSYRGYPHVAGGVPAWSVAVVCDSV